MNPHINDPALQALAARLASVAPQVSTAERNELLYQCAFAAGSSAASRKLRRWQAPAAVLGMLLGVLLSFGALQASSRWTVAKREPQHHQPVPPSPAEVVQPNTDVVRPSMAPVETDAWQLAQSSYATLPDDPALHPLALVSLTRSVLAQ